MTPATLISFKMSNQKLRNWKKLNNNIRILNKQRNNPRESKSFKGDTISVRKEMCKKEQTRISNTFWSLKLNNQIK